MNYKKHHNKSFENKADIQQASIVGCFYCLMQYDPSEITEYIKEIKSGRKTAICPKCMIDSVIPLDSSKPLNENQELLEKLNQYYF